MRDVLLICALGINVDIIKKQYTGVQPIETCNVRVILSGSLSLVPKVEIQKEMNVYKDADASVSLGRAAGVTDGVVGSFNPGVALSCAAISERNLDSGLLTCEFCQLYGSATETCTNQLAVCSGLCNSSVCTESI